MGVDGGKLQVIDKCRRDTGKLSNTNVIVESMSVLQWSPLKGTDGTQACWESFQSCTWESSPLRVQIQRVQPEAAPCLDSRPHTVESSVVIA